MVFVQKKDRFGFSNIELIVGFFVVLVLVGILIYGSGFVQNRMRDLEREKMMKGISVALETYKSQHDAYPTVGTPIVGASVVSANNNFNSMIAALGQENFLDSKGVVDPVYGPLFGEFDGVSSYKDGLKFIEGQDTCLGKPVSSQTDVLGGVSYSYFSADGSEYSMCLSNEDNKVMTFVSPKE